MVDSPSSPSSSSSDPRRAEAGGRGGTLRAGPLPSLLAAAFASLLLLFNTGERLSGKRLEELRAPRRYWEDLLVATSAFLSGPDGAMGIDSPEGADLRHALEGFVIRSVRSQGIRPTQPWRTIAIRSFLDRGRVVLRGSDDEGRSSLLLGGFRLLGGVSPFLCFWLGSLFCIPLFFWTCLEFRRAGRGVAGGTFCVLLASSPYVLDVLSLPYSAAGFYFLGLLALVSFALHCSFVRSASSLLWRAGLVGALLAVAISCRSGTLLLFPALAVSLAVACLRIPLGQPAPRAGLLVFMAGLALLVLPYLAVRPHGSHEAWLGVWEGLGDFDRVKGHTWSDPVARQTLKREGVLPSEDEDWRTPETEAVFRRLVLRDIRADPAWYLAIVARRLVATVLQTKLWPYGPEDGMPFAWASSPNEGATDVYYKLVTGVDHIGFGPWQKELRVGFLVTPLLILPLAAWWLPVGARGGLRGDLLPVGLAALGGLSLPILVTTASAIETEAFGTVHLLALSLIVDQAAASLLSKISTR